MNAGAGRRANRQRGSAKCGNIFLEMMDAVFDRRQQPLDVGRSPLNDAASVVRLPFDLSDQGFDVVKAGVQFSQVRFQVRQIAFEMGDIVDMFCEISHRHCVGQQVMVLGRVSVVPGLVDDQPGFVPDLDGQSINMVEDISGSLGTHGKGEQQGKSRKSLGNLAGHGLVPP